MSANFTLIVATVVHSVDPDGTHVMSVRPRVNSFTVPQRDLC